jgi:hypothetical protein
MGKNEQLLLVMKAGVAEVVSKEGDFARVGEIVKTEIQPANSISETAGQWVNITDYPRLFYFYVNLLPLSYLSTFTGSTVDEPTKWAIDSVNGKFWIPDTGGYFERNQDPTNNVDTDRNSTTNKPGAVQQDELKSHKHVESIGFINSNGTPPIVRTVGTYNGTGTGTPDYTDFVGGSETRAKNVVRMVWRII